MTSTRPDAYNHALSTANTWLADISAALGTKDRHFGRRALRAWLHTLRDRLTVEAVAKFGAQLPELVRGVYYEGWSPSHAPMKYHADEYVQRFAWEARIPTMEVPAVAAAVTSALADRLSPGQIDEAVAALPADLRGILLGAPRATATRGAATARPDDSQALRDQINILAQAIRSLAQGLEDRQLTGVDAGHVARGARLADEILMTIST